MRITSDNSPRPVSNSHTRAHVCIFLFYKSGNGDLVDNSKKIGWLNPWIRLAFLRPHFWARSLGVMEANFIKDFLGTIIANFCQVFFGNWQPGRGHPGRLTNGIVFIFLFLAFFLSFFLTVILYLSTHYHIIILILIMKYLSSPFFSVKRPMNFFVSLIGISCVGEWGCSENTPTVPSSNLLPGDKILIVWYLATPLFFRDLQTTTLAPKECNTWQQRWRRTRRCSPSTSTVYRATDSSAGAPPPGGRKFFIFQQIFAQKEVAKDAFWPKLNNFTSLCFWKLVTLAVSPHFALVYCIYFM